MKLPFYQVIFIYALFPVALLKAEPSYRPYPVDFEALKRHPDEAQVFDRLTKKFETVSLEPAEHEQRMQVIGKVLDLEPQWLDGYWIYAADAYFLGSNVLDPKQHDHARLILSKGLSKLDGCLQRDAKHLLCRFLSAAIQAKIASIDGIFASLKYGKRVRDIWLDVTRSPYDLSLRPNVTLQGSARFALGLFYRLVPDNFIMEWFWGIRGDMKSSIQYHRESLRLDPQNPCAHLMLAVSLLCEVKGDPETSQFKEAMLLLDTAAKEKSVDVAQEVCVADAPRLRLSPKKTCGYTQAKYQDEVPPDQLPKK